MAIPSLFTIIVAAGSSTRFSTSGVKKEFLKLEDGHTVLYHSVLPFLSIPSLKGIIILSAKGEKDATFVALEEIGEINSIPLLVLDGGTTRTESVKKGLEAYKNLPFESDYIAIHDGARPYIKSDEIIKILANCSVFGASAPALRVTDAVKRIDENGRIISNENRKNLIRVQTPQIFNSKNLLEAYKNIKEGGAVDDDIEVYISSNFPCYVTKGNESNKKITYLSDIPNAEEQIKTYITERDRGRESKKAIEKFKAIMEKENENRSR